MYQDELPTITEEDLTCKTKHTSLLKVLFKLADVDKDNVSYLERTICTQRVAC